MPTDEFFNTGIYTYLWIFNKNKAEERKDKVILINGSDFYEPLKKSKGKKRKEMVFDNRKEIVNALTNFIDEPYAKVFDKWHFYYNKQAIMLTNVDEDGKTFESQLPVKKNKEGEEIRAKSIKLNPIKITQVTEEETIEITNFEIKTFDADKYSNLKEYFDINLKPLVSSLNYKESDLKVTTAKTSYYFDADSESIIEQAGNTKTALGCGKIVIKASYKKATKTKEASIVITTELTPDYEKDYEIISYAPNGEDNQQNIADFMAKYITKPFRYIENTIGVEINFNKVFYKPEELRSLSEIISDLQNLEDDLLNLEKELAI